MRRVIVETEPPPRQVVLCHPRHGRRHCRRQGGQVKHAEMLVLRPEAKPGVVHEDVLHDASQLKCPVAELAPPATLRVKGKRT